MIYLDFIMKRILVIFFFVGFSFYIKVVAERKPCFFRSELKDQRELNKSFAASDKAALFLLDGFQDNCLIDLDSIFGLVLNNKTYENNDTEDGNDNKTTELIEWGFHCAERISIRFFTKNSTFDRHFEFSVALMFGRCSVLLEDLSLFEKYAPVWSIIQSSDSIIHVPEQRINCTFSKYLRVMDSELDCDSEANFFWEYCEEVFEKVDVLQLKACAGKHLRMTAETLSENFPQVQALQLNYIDLSTELTFPWTQMYVDATNIRLFISNEATKNKSVKSMGRDIRIYNTDTIHNIHLHGMVTNIVISYANLSQSEIFSNVTGLYKVDISNNNMTEINVHLFKNHSDIKSIYLQGNQLQTVPVNSFEDQRLLLFLDLSKNKLSSIDRNLLRNQQFLQELHLEHNRLKALPYNFLKEQIGSLEFLYLHSNPIKTIPVMPFYGPRIKMIDIHGSDITGDSIIELANNINTYDFLYANNARKSSNPRQKNEKESFQHSVLDLSFCDIRDIHLNLKVQNKISLNMLQMFESFHIIGNGNPFKCNCGLYAVTLLFSNITTNTLDWICSYPEELKGRKVTSLTGRDIYCPVNVNDCPNSCVCFIRFDFSSLVIDCRNIKMETLPPIMPKYPLELWFKNTSLLKLDQRDYFVNVSVLDVSENKITHIQPLLASKLQNVSVLNLKNNYITSLPVQIKYTNIEKLYLDGNSFNCDCHTKWMKAWLLDRSCPVIGWNNIKCTDNTKRVKTFVTIPESVFVCQEVEQPNIAEHVIFPSTIIGSLMFLIVILSLIIYFQRFTVRVLLFMTFGKRICFGFNNYNDDSKYDCVVIYDKSDEIFVDGKIKRHLNKLNYIVADVYKNTLIGFSYIHGIKKLICDSKVTIFCLTRNSLDNDLITCSWNVTCERSLESRLTSIILILDKEFRNTCTDEDMRLFIKNGRYIKMDSILLQKSIQYLMPPKERLNQNADVNEFRSIENNIEETNLTERNSETTRNRVQEYCRESDLDIFIVFPNDTDILHQLIRYDLIPFLRDRNMTVSVLQDDYIFGEDIREGIEPRLDKVKHVILIITNEALGDEVFQYSVSTILTKTFICNNNYLLLLTHGEIDENEISENLKKFVNSHFTASVNDTDIKERIVEAVTIEENQNANKKESYCSAVENYTENENLI